MWGGSPCPFAGPLGATTPYRFFALFFARFFARSVSRLFP